MKLDKTKLYVKYAFDIVEGKIPACIHIKNACRRFIDDFNRDDLIFNYKKVDRVIQFVQILKHHDAAPDVVNTPIILSDWQTFIVANIFGWEYKESGIRRFTKVYVEIARKGAKTQLMAALGIFSLFEYRSANQILLTANTREQAGRLFDFCKAFAKQLDPTGKSLKVLRDRIQFKETGGYVLVLSSDYKSADGFNCYFGVVDEMHEAADSQAVDVLKSGMVKPGSCLVQITTSGFDINSYCYQVRQTVADILAGRKHDDRYFGLIFSIDEDDDWHDKNCWIKAQPNIGKSVSWDFYNDQYQSALNSPSDQRNFLVKNLNVWQQSVDCWIAPGYVDKVRKPVDLHKFKDYPVWVGLDFSAYSDLTSLTYCIFADDEEKYYFYTSLFLPEACLKEGPNAEYYRQEWKNGNITLTSGNVIDYEYILRDILEKMEKYDFVIQKIAYDSWNAYPFVIQANNTGVLRESLFEPCSMSIGKMNNPTKEFERIVLNESCVIDSNPVVAWMIQNVSIKTDHMGNMKPTKSVTGSGGTEIKTKKIDAVISMLLALLMCMKFGRKMVYYPTSESTA